MSLIGLKSVPTPSTCSSARTIASARLRRGVVVYTLATYCATHARASTPSTSSTSSCWPRSMSTLAIGGKIASKTALALASIAREEGLRGPTEMLGHVARICVADVARRFGERPGLRHDPLRGTCGPPARGGLGGSRDQRVDDRGPHVLIELLQDGAHGCTQLWRAHGVQRSVDLGVFRRHAMSPAAKASHSALAPTPCAGGEESPPQSARGEPSRPGIRRRSSIRRDRLTSPACAQPRPTRRRALLGRAASGGWPSSIQVDLREASPMASIAQAQHRVGSAPITRLPR